MRSLAAAALLVLAPTLALASDRPLRTDRPSRTASPYTVPAGWLQVEADVVSRGQTEDVGASLTRTLILPFVAKYGLARNLDVQLAFTPWAGTHVEVAGYPARDDNGTGQAGLRAKFNVTGNDRGNSAIALLPFASIPTRGDTISESVTWGMVAPVVIGFGNERTMGAMVGFKRLNNDETWITGSVSLGTPITGSFSGFFEMYVSRAGFDEGAMDDTTLDFGLTYTPTPNWQFDTGAYLGVTSATEDWRMFVGANARFDLSRK